MLNQFRTFSSGIGAKLLMAFLIMTFAVWGVGDMLRSPGHKAAVATIGDTKITVGAYQRAVQQQTEKLRRAFGDKYSPDLLKNLNIEQQVMQSLVQDALLKQEAKKLQLIPGDSDIARSIRTTPAYQDGAGNFDKARFVAALNQSGMSEKNYIDQQRGEMATALLVNAIDSVQPSLPGAAALLYQARESRREITIYRLTPSLVSNIGEPKQADLEAYHTRNTALFTLPEYRSISYIVIKNDDVRKKATVTDKELRQAYEERLEDFRRPERRSVEQLLFSSEDKARAAYEQIKAGKSFADIAKSGDILNKDSVSLGKIERSHIIDAAQEEVFSIKDGETTAPIKSSFGWHIFRVKGIEAASVAPFEEAREQLRKELEIHAAENALGKLTNTLEDALAGGSTLKEAAAELGLTVQTIANIDRDGKTPEGAQKTIPDLDRFLETAFKTDEKSESSLISSKGGMSYILRVDSATPERVRPLEDVKAAAIEGWKKEERLKRLEALATDIAKKLSDKSTREATLEKYDLSPAYNGEIKRSTHSSGDFDWPSALSQDAFSRKPGEATAPFLMLSSGDYAVAVVGEAASSDVAADKTKIAEIDKELKMHVQSELFAQYLNYLVGKHPVSIEPGLMRPSE